MSGIFNAAGIVAAAAAAGRQELDGSSLGDSVTALQDSEMYRSHLLHYDAENAENAENADCVVRCCLGVLLAQSLKQLGRFHEAEQACFVAMETCPGHVPALQMMGSVIVAHINHLMTECDTDSDLSACISRLKQYKVRTMAAPCKNNNIGVLFDRMTL